MTKKRGPRKKKDRRGTELSPEDRERLNRLLEHPAQLDPRRIEKDFPDPALAAAFLERLPADDPGLVSVLAAVRDAFDHKAVRKAARKTAFRFQQRGITVPPEPSREAPDRGRSTAAKEEAFAFLTPMDGLGVRGVILGIPRVPAGMELGAALAGDESGILQYSGGAFSKKKALAARDEFLAEFQHTVPASAGHALRTLERAHRAKPDAPGAADYLSARPWILDRVSPPQTAPVRSLIPAGEIAARPLTESMAARLLEHEILAAWLVDPREAKPLADQIQEAEDSPIVLSDDQLARRVEEIQRDWMREYFSDTRRALLRDRLEETAFVLHGLEDEELATIACIAADSLEKPNTLFDDNPFLRLLTERTLTLFRVPAGQDALQALEENDPDIGDEEEPPPGLIIP